MEGRVQVENKVIIPEDKGFSQTLLTPSPTLGSLNFGKKTNGYYPLTFMLPYKPNRFKRFFLRYFLDFKWEDKKN